MASQKPWRRKFTASFIRTVSAAVLLVVGIVPANADCADGVARVEDAMQDAVTDLQAAEGLMEEALSGLDRGSIDDRQTCAFMTGSQDRYLAAQTGFERCIAALDAALENCADPNWNGLSASPEHCQTHLTSVNAQLASLPDHLAQYCSE